MTPGRWWWRGPAWHSTALLWSQWWRRQAYIALARGDWSRGSPTPTQKISSWAHCLQKKRWLGRETWHYVVSRVLIPGSRFACDVSVPLTFLR
jgi:hypothetical protein